MVLKHVKKSKLHLQRNKEQKKIQNLFTKLYYVQQIKEDEMGEACSKHRKDENICNILIKRPEWKRPRGRSRHR